MKKQLLFLAAAAAALTSCPSGTVSTLEAKASSETVTIDASALDAKYKNLTLTRTYSDEFDNWDSFREDWDIGNPGYNKPEVGNMGYDQPEEVAFPDGLKGYKNDRFKQPYWSPKAVTLKDGFLVIGTMYDQNVPVYDKDGKKVRDGYALSGAIHSRRQFPYGYFETRVLMDKETATHWDAWWAESNNPFSRAYGEKDLFMPAGGEARARRAKDAVTADNYTDVPAGDRGLNGQQVYEYDMYEWVSNNSSQWQVLHSWAWYGGYPGWEDRYDTRGGDNNYWSTADNLRGNDNGGGTESFSNNYSDGGQASRGDWFYLAMLVTPDKVMMWNFPKDWDWNFDAPAVRKSELTTGNSAFGTSGIKPYRNANTYAPIQVKYSSELGDWGNKHNLIYNAREKLTPENPDIMHAEFFAFYAWDTSDKYTSYENDVDG